MREHGFCHLMTLAEMRPKNPYLTLCDNTGRKAVYQGNRIEEHVTKFEAFIIPHGYSYKCERKSDYLGRLQRNRLDGVGLHGFVNNGLREGSKIEIFWYEPEEPEEVEDFEQKFMYGDVHFPIFVILPEDVIKVLLRRGQYDESEENYL
jgi:hypothetical protein